MSTMRLISNAEIDAAEKKAAPDSDIAEEQILPGLERHVRHEWERALRAKSHIEKTFIDNLSQKEGEYDAAKLADIRQLGLSEDYAMLTAQKCRDAKAWIVDILKPHERHWALEPTPEPELPPDVEENIFSYVAGSILQEALLMVSQTGVGVDPADMADVISQRFEDVKEHVRKRILDEAKKKAENMTTLLEDQLVEGAWVSSFDEFIDDLVDYPAGILKRTVKRRPRLAYEEKEGRITANVIEQTQFVWERVSPWFIFPMPDATTVKNGGLCELVPLTRYDLQKLIGVPGYNDAKIREALAHYVDGHQEWLAHESTKDALEGNAPEKYWDNQNLHAISYWGPARGKDLMEWGLDKKGLEEDMDYEVNVWLLGNYVIKAILNPDRFGDKPYYKTSFENVNGAWWGKGVPQLMPKTQNSINAVLRGIVNNTAYAQGPQIEVNEDRGGDGANLHDIWPFKVWRSTTNQMTEAPAVRFTNVPFVADRLLLVFRELKNRADEETGIPAFAHGDPRVGGAGNTASGLSMLMTAAARGIKAVIGNIDLDIIIPNIRSLYHVNMQRPDVPDTHKGDVRVKVTGTAALIAKEQLAVRRTEFLAQTANPYDMAIMGLAGRAEVLRESIKSLEIDPDKAIQGQVGGQGTTLPSTGSPNAPRTLDEAGAPVSGEDFRTMPRGGG